MITLALVLTPFASADALAALLGLGGLAVDVIPTARGAVAVRAIEVPEEAADEWDIAALVGDDTPAEASELAATISQLTRHDVILVTARLAQDADAEVGLSGHVSARRFTGGEAGEDVPGGLVLAESADVVEDLLLGRRAVADVPGLVNSRDATGGRRGRWLRGRRPRP